MHPMFLFAKPLVAWTLTLSHGPVASGNLRTPEEWQAAHSFAGHGMPQVEQCNGVRTLASGDVQCTGWVLHWSVGGKEWGATVAESLGQLEQKRSQLRAFVRDYGVWFGEPVDERWGHSGAPICQTCQPTAQSVITIPGDPRLAALSAGADLRDKTRASLARLDGDLVQTHWPRLRDLARLAQYAPTAVLAKRYAKTIQAATVALARLWLDYEGGIRLDLRGKLDRVGPEAAALQAALDKQAKDLRVALARSIQKTSGGNYAAKDGAGELIIEVEGTKVTAVFHEGPGRSTWFEGAVELDGTIRGRSLVPPENQALSCTVHATDCGYVYVPAVLTIEQVAGKPKPGQSITVWFQQSAWRHTKYFAR